MSPHLVSETGEHKLLVILAEPGHAESLDIRKAVSVKVGTIASPSATISWRAAVADTCDRWLGKT
jgi:hypothetical protein